MKAGIHPQYFSDAQVVCSCGNMFTVGSTQENIHIELCNNCHPFYTGQQKFVDTASRIEKFESKKKLAVPKKIKVEEVEAESPVPKSLKEMLQALKKG